MGFNSLGLIEEADIFLFTTDSRMVPNSLIFLSIIYYFAFVSGENFGVLVSFCGDRISVLSCLGGRGIFHNFYLC